MAPTRDSARAGWSVIRPVLVGLLLVADAGVVAALVLARPPGWLPPFVAFGSLLGGLIWFEWWAILHRRDDAG